MRKKRNHKNRFILPTMALLIIAAALVGIISHSAKHSKQVKATLASTQSSSQTSAHQYLDIAQWGISIPTSNTDIGLRYTVTKDHAVFTDAALNSFCSTNIPTNGVTIYRGLASDTMPIATGKNTTVGSVETYAAIATKYPQYLIAKVNDYYYLDPDYLQHECTVSHPAKQAQQSMAVTVLDRTLSQMTATN